MIEASYAVYSGRRYGHNGSSEADTTPAAAGVGENRGMCVLCDQRIDGPRERWIVEHIRALELGGEDDLSNMGPAHEACALVKTQDDHRRTARAKRPKIRHIGAELSKRRLPFGKASPWKRTMTGRIIPR